MYSACLFLRLSLLFFLLREKPWSRPSSVKLLSWRNWSPRQPMRRCLGIMVKSPATKVRGGFTLEPNLMESFCKLLVYASIFYFWARLSCNLWRFCVKGLSAVFKQHCFFVSQPERQRCVGFLCSLHDVWEISVPLSDPPGQIGEILNARGNKVWHHLAGRPSSIISNNAAADGLLYQLKCNIMLYNI